MHVACSESSLPMRRVHSCTTHARPNSSRKAAFLHLLPAWSSISTTRHLTQRQTQGWLLGSARVPLLLSLSTLPLSLLLPIICLSLHWLPLSPSTRDPGFDFELATGRVCRREFRLFATMTSSHHQPEQREIPRHVCYMSLQRRTCTRTHRSREPAVLSSHMVSPPVCIPVYGSVTGIVWKGTAVIYALPRECVFRSYASTAGSTGQVPKARSTVL